MSIISYQKLGHQEVENIPMKLKQKYHRRDANKGENNPNYGTNS